MSVNSLVLSIVGCGQFSDVLIHHITYYVSSLYGLKVEDMWWELGLYGPRSGKVAYSIDSLFSGGLICQSLVNVNGKSIAHYHLSERGRELLTTMENDAEAVRKHVEDYLAVVFGGMRWGK